MCDVGGIQSLSICVVMHGLVHWIYLFYACALVCSVRSFVWMNTRVFLVCDIAMLGHCK